MNIKTVYKGASAEIVEKKSRFIGEVYPITSEEEAAEVLEKLKKAVLGCKASLLGICNR